MQLITTPFTRPSDVLAYAAGDVVGTSPGANLLFSTWGANSSKLFILNQLNLQINSIVIATSYTLHLFNKPLVTTVVTDNIPFTIASGDKVNYIGNITINKPPIVGDMSYSVNSNVNTILQLDGDNNIYGVLVTNSAYAPTSACVHTLTIVLGF